MMRRIMQDYFGYAVCFIVSEPDLDDKLDLNLAKSYEQELQKDLQSLGVLQPTVSTKGSDYKEEIIAFIQILVDKGLAYASEGSVYLDSQRMHCGINHVPEPPNENPTEDLLSAPKRPRSSNDLVLWKANESDATAWPSPWGAGRPTRYTESTAMARDVIQKLTGANQADLYSGGFDFSFAKEEMAVAEAGCNDGSNQWANYVLQSGPTNKDGIFMNSLPDSVMTIEQVLEKHSPRQIRLLFLMQKYNLPMVYCNVSISQAQEIDTLLTKFFEKVRVVHRQKEESDKAQAKWDATAFELQSRLLETQEKVDAAFKDDFDTPKAMQMLIDIMSATVGYLDENQDDLAVESVVLSVSLYVTRILKMLGVIEVSDREKEVALAPFMDKFTTFYTSAYERSKEFEKPQYWRFAICDFLEDVCKLGVELEMIVTDTDGSDRVVDEKEYDMEFEYEDEREDAGERQFGWKWK
jgi:cysteinyl-tRNA synthetase